MDQFYRFKMPWSVYSYFLQDSYQKQMDELIKDNPDLICEKDKKRHRFLYRLIRKVVLGPLDLPTPQSYDKYKKQFKAKDDSSIGTTSRKSRDIKKVEVTDLILMNQMLIQQMQQQQRSLSQNAFIERLSSEFVQQTASEISQQIRSQVKQALDTKSKHLFGTEDRPIRIKTESTWPSP